LIYGFFLLSVLVYLWIRKLRSDEASSEAYRVLDLLERGIDPNLTAHEQGRLQQHLRQIATRSTQPRAALILGFLVLAIRGLLVAITILILMVEVVAPAGWQQIVAMPWVDNNPIGAPRLILFAFV
jgi:hypothetical protein